MISIKRISVELLFILLCNLVVKAGIKIEVIAPTSVTTEENFRLQYKINTHNIEKFINPTISSPFEILSGPNQSMYSSTQIINGRSSSVSTITYTFILSASKEGTYTLPSAKVVVDGHTYISKSQTVKVLKGSSTNKSARGKIQNGNQPSIKESNSKTVSGKDFFITATINKGSVYQQEPVVLTYKIYTRVDLQNFSGGTPDLQGFYSQEIDLSKDQSYNNENFKGNLYRTIVWRKYVLFPQETGELKIPAVKFEGIILKHSKVIDPFESFFSGTMGAYQVKVTRFTPSITLKIKSFNNTPTNFSGAVGNISMSSKLLTKSFKSNEPFTFRVTFTGTGNLKLTKEPQIQFPASFDTYETKKNDNTKLSTNGFTGSISYDYLVVPREQGKQTIPAVDVSYYDLTSKSFKHLHSDAITINVAKGKHSNVNAKNTLNSDIHFIHIGKVSMMNMNSKFWNTLFYWGIYLLLIIVVLLTIIITNILNASKRSNNSSKKSGRAVRICLKNAKKLISSSDDAPFYDEISKALENFAIAKLKLTGKAGTDDVLRALDEHKLNPEIKEEYKLIMEDCDFARFAPSQFTSNKKEVFTRVSQLLSNLENKIK